MVGRTGWPRGATEASESSDPSWVVPVSGPPHCTSGKIFLVPQAGIQGVAQAVAEEVKADDDHHDGQAGDSGHVGGDHEVAPGVGEHSTPLGSLRLDTEPQEAESRVRREHRGHRQGGLDDDGGQTVGQEVTKHYPATATNAVRASRLCNAHASTQWCFITRWKPLFG